MRPIYYLPAVFTWLAVSSVAIADTGAGCLNLRELGEKAAKKQPT